MPALTHGEFKQEVTKSSQRSWSVASGPTTSYTNLSVQDTNLLNLVDQYRQCSALELSIHGKISESSLLKSFTPLVQLGWLVKTGTSPARFRVADKTSKYFIAQKEKEESERLRLIAEEQARVKQIQLTRLREHLLAFQGSIDRPKFINIHHIAQQSSVPVSVCYSLLPWLVDGKLLQGKRREDDTRKCDYQVLPLVLAQTTQASTQLSLASQNKQEPRQGQSSDLPAAQHVDSLSTSSDDSYDPPTLSFKAAIKECKRVIAQADAEESDVLQILELPTMYFREDIIRIALNQMRTRC